MTLHHKSVFLTILLRDHIVHHGLWAGVVVIWSLLGLLAAGGRLLSIHHGLRAGVVVIWSLLRHLAARGGLLSIHHGLRAGVVVI